MTHTTLRIKEAAEYLLSQLHTLQFSTPESEQTLTLAIVILRAKARKEGGSTDSSM
ncbi:hypothetical protein [Endozoicomonas sp. GU-1]|uniref:hypothetical protein n=1 Tax=Endozoicomonas sp. GU-1 TaxID=3009078 RepID=UPI0022B3B781|nr:hypothetical protein [Endozoicomonas sp. GU-1]WBA81537.1 hypothetical protein O2T12_25255 [Endozoicomonas sp. GU-1]WBA84487.1 hypothetical protein O3276_14420 [Endozoicomonas sp. GU-1]